MNENAVASTIDPGNYLLGAPEWVVPAGIAVIVITLLVIWNYAARGTSGPVGVVASLLKIVAIVLIAICLLEPLRSGTRPRPQANIVSILADNSQSMQLKSISDDRSRGRTVMDRLDKESPWRVRLAQAFDVRTYSFDARLENVEDFQSLPLNGYVSSLTASLRSLQERFAGRPVGGVLLFTDGNLTDLPGTDFDWSTLGFPIYPVLPAINDDVRDLRISDVSIRQTDFESAPTTIRISVDSVAMDDQSVVVQLIDLASNKVIEEKKTQTNETDGGGEVRFRFRPDQAGVNFFRVAAFVDGDRDEFKDGKPTSESPKTNEATLANNHRVVAVNRATGPYRILYVAGRPNWEYKFIRRALQEDAEIQMVALLRIAKKEPKFSFRDRGVSGTNPLFAGLGKDEEDAAQQYDEPVIIRLGVKESEELSDGFPESSEELFAYHGVILDDLEPEFFTQDQMLLLKKFVSARGGGLLMLGGQESFDSRRFGDTPLGDLAPVYAPRRQREEGFGPVNLSITREGMLQPWMRLRDNEAGERQRTASMPPFLTLNEVGDVKPGASLMATVDTRDGKTLPAIVAQRFGKGRSAAIPIGDLWRWSMRRDEKHPDDAAQTWRQITHWLVNEVPRRAEVRVESSKDPSQPVTIIAVARDESYLPLDNATVKFKISPIEGETFTLNADADGQLAGTYKASYWSRTPGGYHVEAMITAADGSHVGSATAGWTVQTGAAEFGDLQINRKLLSKIAQQTGGEVVVDDQLDQFAADLPNKKVPVRETWIYPIWHSAWVMGLAMLCLCAEWGLRRWKGLA